MHGVIFFVLYQKHPIYLYSFIMAMARCGCFVRYSNSGTKTKPRLLCSSCHGMMIG